MRHLEVVVWLLFRVVSWNLQTPKQRRGSGPFRGTWAVYLQLNCELLEVDRDILGRHLLSILSLECEIRSGGSKFCSLLTVLPGTFLNKSLKLFSWGSFRSEISSHGAGASHLHRRWSIFLMPSCCRTEMSGFSNHPWFLDPQLDPQPPPSLERPRKEHGAWDPENDRTVWNLTYFKTQDKNHMLNLYAYCLAFKVMNKAVLTWKGVWGSH